MGGVVGILGGDLLVGGIWLSLGGEILGAWEACVKFFLVNT
jgi:hypothetical protein